MVGWIGGSRIQGSVAVATNSTRTALFFDTPIESTTMTSKERQQPASQEEGSNMVTQTASPRVDVQRKTFRYDADFHLKVNCGCGHSASSVEDGLAHAETTGHTLHITGEIRAQK